MQVFTSIIAEDRPRLSRQQLAKLHAQFGHASSATLQRLLNRGKFLYDLKELEAIAQAFPCFRQIAAPQNPIVSSYVYDYPGRAVFMDTFYPVTGPAQEHPALVMTCGFSRFVLARFAPS